MELKLNYIFVYEKRLKTSEGELIGRIELLH